MINEQAAQWFKKAEGDLRMAKLAYEHQEYWGAVSHLQEADEKLGKAILLQLGFLPTSQSLTDVMKLFFGVQRTKPKDYRHDWHANLLKELEPYIGSFEEITKSLGKSDSLKQAADWWKKTLPGYKENLKKAKNLRNKPLPLLTELDMEIEGCNMILDLAEDVPTKVRLDDVKLPEVEKIDPSVNDLIRKFLHVQLDKKTRMKAESTFLARFSDARVEFQQMLKKTAQLSHVLIVVAALSVYLSKHHTLARYPSNTVNYDSNFPLVKRFIELHPILERSLRLAKLEQ